MGWGSGGKHSAFADLGNLETGLNGLVRVLGEMTG